MVDMITKVRKGREFCNRLGNPVWRVENDWSMFLE
jgi:hypothetical protein